jgi:hypothetical protein
VEPVFFLIIDSHFTPGTGRIKSGTSKSPAIPVRKKGPKNYLNTKNNRITNNPKKTYHCQDSSLSKDVPGFCKVISCTKLALLNAGMHTIKLHCIPECLFSTPYAVAHDTLVR